MGGKIIRFFAYVITIVSLTTCWYFFTIKDVKPRIKIEKRVIISYDTSETINKTKEDYLFDLKFKYLLNNRVCNKGNHNITAVILVTSYYGNVETRSAMRRAFSNEELIDFDMRRVFLIAIPPESDKSMNPKAILNEQERFGDLIQGNFIEAYRNLTYKHTMGLQWAAKYCKNAKFIVKMDDDIVVDIYKVSEFLHKFELIENSSIAGYVLNGMTPIREPANKWYVTKSEYAPSTYPKFVSGWFYILTPKVARSLTKLARKVPYFWIDDVFITGILAKKLGLKHLDIKPIFAVHPEYLQCCMQDLKAHNYYCPIMVGPNGGDNNLFFTFNEVMSKCFIYWCKARPKNKELELTCVAERKIHIGHGKALVEKVNLF